jgi:hypothetical protein
VAPGAPLLPLAPLSCLRTFGLICLVEVIRSLPAAYAPPVMAKTSATTAIAVAGVRWNRLRIAENIGYLSFWELDVVALSATHGDLSLKWSSAMQGGRHSRTGRWNCGFWGWQGAGLHLARLPTHDPTLRLGREDAPPLRHESGTLPGTEGSWARRTVRHAHPRKVLVISESCSRFLISLSPVPTFASVNPEPMADGARVLRSTCKLGPVKPKVCRAKVCRAEADLWMNPPPPGPRCLVL